MLRLSRRRLLSITANVAVAGSLVRAGIPGLALAQETSIRATLARLARDLYPHDQLPDSVYDEIAGMIIAQESASTGDMEMIHDGLALLDRQAGGNWAGQGSEARQAALKAISSTDFFLSIQGRVNGALYLRKETWDLVGYGGSAFEQGGYINRGFDDIDWL